MSSQFAIALLVSFVAKAMAIGLCPILGPVFPQPQNLSNSSTFQLAMDNLTSILDEAFRTGNSTRGPILSDDTYSIQIFSTSEEGSAFEYYHAGADLVDTVGDINGDSIYLIGSISKAWTVYMLLIEAGYDVFADPVTKYLPELQGIGTWDEVSVGALAGQVGGVVADLISFDQSVPEASLATLFPGTFPELSANETSPCIANVTHCTREEFLGALTNRRSTNLPNTTPAYSNAGFALLGYIIESISGKSYREVLEERIIKPLNLTHTSDRTPSDPNGGVIINNATFSGWNFDITEATAMGGLFASASDLSAVGRSILSSSLLPANVTRAWLKPTSFTSSLIGGVGRPWEIYRASIDEENNRVVDMYTKGGFLGVHHTHMALLPDYNVGFVVLDASAKFSQALGVASLVADVLLPTLENVGREQADARFAGTYIASNGLNSSITLSTTPRKPGLLINSWISNSTDVTPVFGMSGELRLYPTNIESKDGREFSWRVSQTIDFRIGERGPFSACPSWEALGRPSYGIYEVDELAFHLDEDGNVLGLEPKALKIVLQKN